MAKTQCKYTNERLSEILRERGLAAALEDIDARAIADLSVRAKWSKAQSAMTEIEEALLG